MGFATNIFFPQGVIGIGIELLGILALSILRKLKTLVISYTHPPNILRELLVKRLIEAGLDREK